MAIQSRNMVANDRIVNEQNVNGNKAVSVNFAGGPSVAASNPSAAANLWDAAKEAKELVDKPGVTVRITFDDANNTIQSISVTRTA